MAVMAGRDAIVGTGGQDLLGLHASVFPAGFRDSRTAGTRRRRRSSNCWTGWGHVDEVLLADHRFDHEAQVLGNRIAVAFAHDLAGILNGELDFQILIPVGVDLQFAFTDPLGIIFVDALDLEFDAQC